MQIRSLDTHLGSQQIKYDLTACEKNITMKRIKQHQSQLRII